MNVLKDRKNPQWGSSLGFVLTAAGAAVGFGNLQRFPQMVSEHGGGAFLLLYLACVFLFGWPLMLVEFALGRAGKANPITSFTVVAPQRTVWRFVGGLGVLTAFCIFSYYSVICAWTIVFTKESLVGHAVTFDQIASNPAGVWGYLILFHLVAAAIIVRGLNKGLERVSKVIMPMLFIMQLVLVVRVLMMKNSLDGLWYYINPDFSKLTGDSLIHALSQAFFSLCIGEAVLITYGSYVKKDKSLPQLAFYVFSFDTAVAFLSGLVIFPALFATGQQNLQQGTALIYNVIPEILKTLPFGSFFQVGFFAILTIAGLTTCIALLEASSYTLSETMHLNRKACVLIVGLFAFLFGIPSLYSKGGSPALTSIQLGNVRGFYNMMDFFWGGIAMIVTGLLTTIFVGWVWGARGAARELSRASVGFKTVSRLWRLHIRWTAPALIAVILISVFW
ncbi:MAG: sodium-dependent transporter [Myxococcota bacterium]